MAELDLWSMLFVFMLATFIGFQVIQTVSRLLHTPLMSLTNAISAIAVVGAIVVAGEYESTWTTVLGTIAVAASMTNIVSGFLITDRFHQMVGSMFEFDGRAAYPADVVPLVRDAFSGRDAANGWDEAYTRAVGTAAGAHPVQVSAVRYESIDTAAHHALRDREPDAFEPGPAFDALDRAYAEVDRDIGVALERLMTGDLLLDAVARERPNRCQALVDHAGERVNV